MRNPRDFAKPLAVGAPDPGARDPGDAVADDPFLRPLEREDRRQAARTSRPSPTSCSATSRTRSRSTTRRRRAPASCGSARRSISARRALWTRVNSLESPWVLDDITTLVTEIGDRLSVIMVPKVEGPWDIHYVDRLLAQLEARAGLERPILVHAILETVARRHQPRGDRPASPRMQGMSFGPADLAASRRMKTTRVGGGHPGYRVLSDPDPDEPRGAPAQRPAGPLALLDRAHGRRLHRDRDPALTTGRSATSATSPAARRSSAPRS